MRSRSEPGWSLPRGAGAAAVPDAHGREERFESRQVDRARRAGLGRRAGLTGWPLMYTCTLAVAASPTVGGRRGRRRGRRGRGRRGRDRRRGRRRSSSSRRGRLTWSWSSWLSVPTRRGGARSRLTWTRWRPVTRRDGVDAGLAVGIRAAALGEVELTERDAGDRVVDRRGGLLEPGLDLGDRGQSAEPRLVDLLEQASRRR